MGRKSRLHISALLALMIACTATATAEAASWSSFTPAILEDIYVTPPLADGITAYTLSLGSNPTITLDGNTYPVLWLQAFYAVGDTAQTVVDGTPAGNSLGWTWEAKTSPGDIAGWHGDGQSRLYPTQSGQFNYGTLTVYNGAVAVGVHAGYDIGGGTVVTAFHTDTMQPPPPPNNDIPEFPASSLAAMGSMAMAGLLRRIRSRRG